MRKTAQGRRARTLSMWGAAALSALSLASSGADAQPRTAPARTAPARTAPARTVERWLADAERAHSRGSERQAWMLWQRAVERAPADARAPLRMAAQLPVDPSLVAAPSEALRARARATQAALEAHLAATEAAATDAAAEPTPEAHRELAWTTAVLGQHDAAIDLAVARAGLQDEGAATLLQRLAALAIRRDDPRSAHRALTAAHRALPQDGGVLSDLGALELALGRPASAVELFARALGGRPEDLEARRDLGGALVAAGRAAEAVALLESAVEAHPDVVELRVELARAALEAGQAARAEQVARQLVTSLTADDARGHSALGEALAAQQRGAAAEDAFREALRRNPRDLRARRGLEALRTREPPP